MKKKITTPLLIVVLFVTCTLIALLFGANHRQPLTQEQTTPEIISNCVKLHSGIAVVEITYPKQFFVHTQNAVNSTISFSTSTDVDSAEEFLLMVRASIGDNLSDIIGGRELGPKYSTSTLNGYTVGLHHGQYWDDYVLIPEGSKDGFFVNYHESVIISTSERVSAEALLHSIKISTTTEKINLARVEKCVR